MANLFLMLPILLVEAAILGLLIYLLILLIKALRKYLRSKEVREESAAVRRQMTQEFVAERLGVSRQAVSKWESGASDPSTSNLLALAKLFQVSPEELLREVEPKTPPAS